MKTRLVGLLLLLITPANILAAPLGKKKEALVARLNTAFTWISSEDQAKYGSALKTFQDVEFESGTNEDVRQYASYGIALCLFGGFGVEKNHEAAFNRLEILLMQSFDNRVPDAEYIFAECCYEGFGKREKTFGHFWRAAERGVMLSRLRLAEFMLRGDKQAGTDYQKVYGWLKDEAGRNNPKAQYLAGMFCYHGLSEVDGKKDYPSSLNFLKRACDNNYDDAKREIVKLFYLNEKSQYADSAKAFLLLSQMANEGNSKACYMLGVFNLTGKIVPKDVSKGLKWLELAANKNHLESISLLGVYHYVGGNEEKAMSYYKKYLGVRTSVDALIMGSPSEDNGYFAESLLGVVLYNRGDYEDAVSYLKQAERCNRMFGEAAKKYAICYKWGYGGLPVSPKKADEWMERSASLESDIHIAYPTIQHLLINL